MEVIDVRNVAKTFRLPHERRTRLAARVVSSFRPARSETFTAISVGSLSVPAGAFRGIIGPNGSGKSTLLKIIAGLLVPDAGEVHVRGTMSPLLELGLGFHLELTACDNVSLYGAILGYPPDTMAQRVDAVIEFAELKRFRDAKLKSFSSGMVARLAFATA